MKYLEYLNKEGNKLIELRQRILPNIQEWVEKVQEDLWIDQLIDQYLQTLSREWELEWQKNLKQEHADVCNAFREFKGDRKKVYRKLHQEKGLTEDEVHIILRIFVRYYFLAKCLYCLSGGSVVLDEQLHPFKEKFPFDSM